MIELLDVVAEVRTRYGLDVELVGQLAGGIESQVVRACGADADVVIRVSPRWRTVAELEWAYELASFVALTIREALAPVTARDGSLVLSTGGHVVSVFPYVHGAVLDRTNEQERDAAASLLARLHRTMPQWPAARARPDSRPERPSLAPNVDLLVLPDAELDDTVARFSMAFRPALSHGDYYRGNLRCMNHEIVAVFDWDDASWWTHENELAWSVWEFAQSDTDATLDVGRAERFLRVYESSGGPVSLADRSFIVPFIRDDIRTEIREAEAGLTSDDAAYIARSYAAFDKLASVSL